MKETEKEQEDNMAKLVITAFRRLDNKSGVTANEITKYLQDKFGDIWSMYNLTKRAEETLKRSAALGFLNKRGDRYVENFARVVCGRRRRCTCRQRKRRCGQRRRRRCGC
ncbi:unnamed protein product [Leptosia nina]|uniref:H15 domain-containing protein n=1 Tax=Leptosia nina TaxID=320188 RepID=A0AAV1K2W4_9NEOP